MQKEITIKEFTAELIQRIDTEKGIDCCKEEIKKFAVMAAAKMPDDKILVNWKE
ncbi:MAG: hypothetical protein PQJ61_16875 [Spirochaetales bacterium]|uniref:Uncharacterized protein n=1 Tax=Candidatus Thalassospirochaeta sargassi TaxID=3119039 RepID=A0AAJ1MKC7_9SPIO|nr:hypothetical protein [Spirochaetales bacterium]